MKVRFNDRITARNLRKQGYSFSEIREKIPDLSKGTLNAWLKDIELTDYQKQRILRKIQNGASKGRVKGAFKNHQKRLVSTRLTIKKARNETVSKVNEPFFVAGVMLYWAEGRKTAELVELTNSDPIMIKFMMSWFRKECSVAESKFRIRINIHALLDRKLSEKYWSKVTGISVSQFNKTIVKPTKYVGRRNSNYLGTCSIIISDKGLFRKLIGWKQGILENKVFAPVA